MSDVWYYAQGERTVGPVTLAELTAVLSRVTFANYVLIWREGSPDWVKAENVPELSALFINTKPTPPPLPSESRSENSGSKQAGTINASSPTFHRWYYMKKGEVFESSFFRAITNWLVGLLVFTALGMIAAVWFSGTYLPLVTLVFGFPPRPIFALILFLIFFSVGVGMLARYGLWLGNCPHCDQELAIKAGRKGTQATDCPICTKRVFLKDGQFRAV